MFVQFIEGRVTDVAALRRQLERWVAERSPHAEGWLGVTAGATVAGTAFIAVRFNSLQAARENADASGQSAWWTETQAYFDGEPSFQDVDDVALLRGGGSDDAGFVQVIRGRANDVDAARALLADEELPDDVRPDVIGGFVGFLDDGSYTMVVYFTSEAEARAGEREQDDAAGDASSDPMGGLHDTPPRFLDLVEPWFWSA